MLYSVIKNVLYINYSATTKFRQELGSPPLLAMLFERAFLVEDLGQYCTNVQREFLYHIVDNILM